MYYDKLNQPLEIGSKVYITTTETTGTVIKHTAKMVTIKYDKWNSISSKYSYNLIRITEQLEFAKKEWPENFI